MLIKISTVILLTRTQILTGKLTCGCITLTILMTIISVVKNVHHDIEKRSLIFPRTTVLQFTYGLTVPLVLPKRAINLSLCAQVNYNLPDNLTALQPKIIMAKSQNDDISRGSFYKYAVGFLNTFGLEGEDCLLRLVCDISKHPMEMAHRDNLLEEIVQFLFTPSLDSPDDELSRNLIEAEKLGRENGKCDEKYSDCPVELSNLFTSKFFSDS